MTHYLWFAAIPASIFVLSALGRLTADFCFDRNIDEWWSFPLLMAIWTTLLPMALMGIAVAVAVAVLLGAGTGL